MKKNAVYFAIVNLIGVVFLAAAAMHFKSPLFGWLITGAIIAVFSVGMERYRKVWLHLAKDEDLLDQYQKQAIPEAIGNGIIAERIRLVQSLAQRSIQVDSRVYSEILSARESSTTNRSAGGIVVLLGLAGTFYGLMVAVAKAGFSLDANNSATTLQAIGEIFSSMNGIFGTSFSGLFAALVLNFTHSIITSRKMEYMADVEEYTQFHLLPAYAKKEDSSEQKQQEFSAQFEAKMADIVVKFGDRLESVFNHSLERIESLQSKLSTDHQAQQQQWNQQLQDLQNTAAKSMQNSVTSVMQEMQSSTTAWESTRNSTLAALKETAVQAQTEIQNMSKAWSEQQAKSISTFMDVMQNTAKDMHEVQVARFGEQWQSAVAAMQTALTHAAEGGVAAVTAVQSVAEKVAAQGNTSLEALQNIAHRVSEQADARAVSLSQNVGNQLQQLSQEVQHSFGMLAESSKALVESQKTLMSEMQTRQEQEKNIAAELQFGVVEAGKLMRVNQSEFQASLDMFRQGVEALLDRYSGGSAEQETQRGFIEQLHASLEAFSEKSSEVLIENAVRTQEILLEILDRSTNQENG